MLSFLVFEGDQPQRERVLRHAHLLGPESVPVSGEVRFESGVIRCTKPTAEAGAIGIQVGLDQQSIDELGLLPGADDEQAGVPGVLGQLTLRTCLLPERERPYLLSLELARHRLMLYLNKLEDWGLFDMGPDHEITLLFERARLAFTRALVAQGHAPDGAIDGPNPHGFNAEAHRQAVRSLWLGVEAGERLTLEAARREFAPRMDGTIYNDMVERSPHPPASRQRATAPVLSVDRPGVALPMRPAIGCSVAPASFGEAAQQAAQKSLDYLQVPMRWIEMEPEEGKYAFRGTDQWIEWAVRRAKLPVVAGPVIDFRQRCVPEWLYVWENDYDTLREFVYEHLKNLVTRYRRTIGRWIVLGGIHANDNFHFSFDEMMDLTRICVLVVRKLHPQAQVVLEITHPWGEYHTKNRRSLPPMLYADMVSQAGITVDGFSLRVKMGQAATGQSRPRPDGVLQPARPLRGGGQAPEPDRGGRALRHRRVRGRPRAGGGAPGHLAPPLVRGLAGGLAERVRERRALQALHPVLHLAGPLRHAPAQRDAPRRADRDQGRVQARGRAPRGPAERRAHRDPAALPDRPRVARLRGHGRLTRSAGPPGPCAAASACTPAKRVISPCETLTKR
jgi:hypothetical protein